MKGRLALVLCAFASACNAEKGKPKEAAPSETETSKSDTATAPKVNPLPSASASPTAAVSADNAPQEPRGYGPAHVKLMPCMSLEAGGVLSGTDCASGFVTYGPYVPVAANANVDFMFEVEARTEITVYSEIVSEAGKVFYAAIPEQTVKAGTRRAFAQRVHVFSPVQEIEARIVVRSATPAKFNLHGLALLVN